MFSDVVSTSLSESAVETIIFVLRNKVGGDPFEVFWEHPKVVYEELRKIFGDGTDVLINLWVKAFKQKAESNVDPEKFIRSLQRGDLESVKEVRRMLMELVTAYHEARGKGREEG
ncbi:MAG: hypothetical protein N0A00_04955 [Candidatus Bathyarchaeota archaeon]|nr:hypothetical protein [Candidatus Bathyarchaeota archaeon]